ncbi:MAG: hypothetical protein ABI723_13095 [Bacteroidia bacterium]
MNKFLFPLILFFIINKSFAQQSYIPLVKDFNARYEPYLDKVGSDMHTSVKPYLSNEVRANAPYDSLNTHFLKDKKFNQTWWGRKIFQEHLLQVKKDDYFLFADFVFDFSYGQDSKADKSFYTNSRGLWAGGTIGKGFAFSSYFFENQATYPTYVDSLINLTHVVPGQGRPKSLYGSRDFAFASANVSYSLKKYFTFQLGTDKNFIGEGYRSLLLSDYAFYYPYFKIETNIWKIKYMCMWTAFQDLMVPSPPGINPDDYSFRKKYATYHYLDFNIGKNNRASIGIMEAVIWRSDSVRAYSVDFNYANPIIFLRPVEFSMSSPDNVVLGLNTKFKVNSNNILYGQLLLDEFRLESLKANDGDYRNKFGLQGGYKAYNIFGVANLRFQTEFNYVKPYTYSHRSSITNYGHYNEPLAHPQGANFYESVSFLNYKYKQWFFQAEVMYVKTGLDTAGLNFGKNIFKSYEQAVHYTGNYMAQGLETKITYVDLKVSYLINPAYNLKVEAGITNRKSTNNKQTMENNFISFGIKTSICNHYYDF